MELLSIVIAVVAVFIMMLLNLVLAFRIRSIEDQLRETKVQVQRLEDTTLKSATSNESRLKNDLEALRLNHGK